MRKEDVIPDTPLPPQQPSKTARGTGETVPLNPGPTALATKTQPLADPSQEQPRVAKEATRSLQESTQPKQLTSLQKPLAAAPPPAAAQSAQAGVRRDAGQMPKPAGPAPADNSGTTGRTPQLLAAARSHRAIISPAAKEQITAPPPEKPRETRGIVVASVQGDLKMVIAGDGGIRLSVTFRAYPKARRNKVLTRSEARQEQKVVPVFAKTRQDTREAVIETTGEGIYVFSAESDKGEPTKATFTVKTFEAGPRERITAIGNRAVSGKAVLTKVLMPDGIVWDDDSAFTGSMEDSNSITKFNAQTGLFWKEYND